MEENRLLGTFEHHRGNGEKKYHPNAHRDVKRKLSFINKKIGDLQRQRKFVYKNSAKVKKVVHYQVNQIVKCLRTRERSLWADVDEAYLFQDENISDELSRLQSVHARCQVLFDNLDDDRGGDKNVFDKIYSILSEVNFGEKPDIKALEFISDFETMKSMANYFGHLDGDFIKRDGFICIDKKDSNSSGLSCREFYKEGCVEKTIPLANIETENSKNGSCKLTESEDSFEIVDLLENMCCEDFDKDSVMVEQENLESCNQPIECNRDYPSENGSKLMNLPNSTENSERILKSSDFNPEEEWKHIFEMRNRIANFNGIASKQCDENKNFKIENTAGIYLNPDKCYDKNCKRNKYLFLKEVDKWLHDTSSRKDRLYDKSCKQNKLVLKDAGKWLYNRSIEKDASKERNFERVDTEINSDSSPAALIRQAFTSYLTKEGIEKWLLCN